MKMKGNYVFCVCGVWCVESVRNEKISESDAMQVCVLIDSAQELNIFSVFFGANSIGEWHPYSTLTNLCLYIFLWLDVC